MRVREFFRDEEGVRTVREVICGPFHSGHRAEWARVFQEQVRAGKAHACLYLVPTRGMGSVVRRLVLDGIDGVAGEQVLTLFEVVEDILRRSERSYICLDALGAERLVAKVMGRLPGQWKGKPLGEWALAPGVVAAFRQHIGELKRAKVDPRALLPHVAGTADEETVRVLADVHDAYQQELRAGEVQLLDTEETYLEAERLLQEKGLQGLFPGVEHVFIDYFTDFQPHQMAVVLPLLQAERVQVYLPYQVERWGWMESLSELMEKTISTFGLHGLKRNDSIEEAVPEGLADDIRQLQARLFAPHPDVLEAAPNVQVFQARTQEKEWLWVSKRIKELHADGVALSDIAILTNRELSAGSTAHRVLKREGVPVQQAVTLTAEGVPWVRDLLALYTVEDEAWHRDVIQQLASAEWLLGNHPLSGKETVPVRVAKQYGIVKGLDAWKTRLAEVLRKEMPEEERADLEALVAWIAWIESKVREIKYVAKGPEHVQALRALLPDDTMYSRLVTHFRAGKGYTVDYLQRDLRARDALMNVLRALENMEALLGEDSTCTRTEFVQLLWNHLQAEEITIERGKRAGVAFLNPSAARGLSFAHVFLVGLNEGEWPSLPSTPWLLREGLREELAGNTSLLAPQVQSDQEKLFFLMGLHTARQGVWASHVSGSKQDLPSRFLDALYELCPALEPEESDEYLGGSALFPTDARDISNEREALDFVASQLANGVLSAESLLLVEPEEWRHVLAQAESERDRSGRFDGVLEDPAIHERLAARYSEEAVYSVSLFNRYGECGYKFFLSRVLTLESEQEEEEELSALEKGNLYHRVLYRLYSQLTGKEAITTEEIECLRGQLEPIFEEEWKAAQSQRRTEIGLRQTLEKERLLRRLRDWFAGEAEAWQTQGLKLVPRHLEWSFGMGGEEPIQVGALKFRGQIDRIDATGDGRFFLVDYKSKGTKAIPKDIERGLDFQMPVYLRALETTLFAKGSAVGAAYYSIERVDRKTSALVKEEYLDALDMGKKRTKFDGESWEQLLDGAERTLEQYRVQMTQGEFRVLPKDRDKCQYCEYRRICRFDALRALSQESQEGGEQHG